MYEDEIGIVADHYFDGKHIIHSEIKVEPTLSVLKHCKEVSDAIDAAFAERGIDRLYTWGSTENHHRYNVFLGYIPTGMQYTLSDGNEYLEYAKDL